MLFNNTIKWIEAFVPMDTELVKDSEKAAKGSKRAKEGSSKRARSNLEQEDAMRQRLEEENESAEPKRCLEIVPEDDDDRRLGSSVVVKERFKKTKPVDDKDNLLFQTLKTMFEH
uniref:Uncharacterized protein n=1 Tax=Tanacetum cinerariifolium TaxID=118510 RepID=A0A699GP83_TANCI|nr:hypothetical protein [Tanacetum cinerariifolium]